jgi:glycosyltransferase involved in cell wall biosynthesis
MDKYPKITIITPSYNQGQFIEETILSVLNQNYPNIEYILMDGGSIDETVGIIKKYAQKITYWESKNDKGQTYAINKGFKIATGEYIGWLNSDDYLEPNVLENIVKAFEEEDNIGTVLGKIYIINEKGKKIGERFNGEEITAERLLNGGVQVIQPGTFHRKILLEKYGYLDESLNYVMDYELWIRLARYSKFKQINRYVANHRFHKVSKTQAEFIKFIPEIKRVRKKYGGKFFCKKTYNIARVELGYLRRKLLGV